MNSLNVNETIDVILDEISQSPIFSLVMNYDCVAAWDLIEKVCNKRNMKIKFSMKITQSFL